MAIITYSDILDDLKVAEKGLRKFEKKYNRSTKEFYELYTQGLLDDGENLEDFCEWAAYCKLKADREALLKTGEFVKSPR